MRPGEIIGMLFIAAGAIVLVMRFSLPGLPWFAAAVLLAGIGIGIIWFSSRQRKLRDNMLDNGHDIYPDHRSGSRASNEIDIGADD